MTSTMLSLIFITILIPVFGWLSDRNDRLSMQSFSATGLLVMAYPFMHAVNFGSAPYFLLMQLLISIPCACYYSVSSVLLTELFPLQIRCTALSITFSIAASLAAGVPPLLADYLARITGFPDSPSLIVIIVSIIVLRNIRILFQDYRIGKNHYSITGFSDEPPVFTIQYQKNPVNA